MLQKKGEFAGQFALAAMVNPTFRSPQRISVTVPFRIWHSLVKRSNAEGRSISNLAAFLLEAALDDELCKDYDNTNSRAA